MARLVARLKACPDEELEFSHRLLQPLWSVMLWHASKSATPLQCAVTKNASVNPLECVVAKSLDLKSLRMNTYKKGWGYPPVEAPVKPSKTKTSGFRSRAGVSCVVVDFSEAWPLDFRSGGPSTSLGIGHCAGLTWEEELKVCRGGCSVVRDVKAGRKRIRPACRQSEIRWQNCRRWRG